MKNPWLEKAPPHYYMLTKEIQPVTVSERLTAIEKFNLKRLKSVALWPHTQKTVYKAILRRIRKIQQTYSKNG